MDKCKVSLGIINAGILLCLEYCECDKQKEHIENISFKNLIYARVNKCIIYQVRKNNKNSVVYLLVRIEK